MAGLYLHIPFCKQACHYCDFHFSTNNAAMQDMVNAMRTELLLQKDYLGGEIIETIYFGGGTPSLLTSPQLTSLLTDISSLFDVKQDAEITLEANPDDLSRSKLVEMRTAGVTRLSIGIQTFDDDILQFLNRPHSSSQAINCFNDARNAGFNNLSLDLIYAIPGQQEERWIQNIRQAIALEPEHISAYSLTIEKKTVFGNWADKGKLIPSDDNLAARELERLSENLVQANYHHYEVSNFAKPGFESRHNSSYWKQVKYLGIGPSAHSFNGETRQWNISNNHLYMKAIGAGTVPAEIETLSQADKINEYLLTTLRTSWGCQLDLLKVKYNYDLLKDQEEYVETLSANGLAVIESGFLKLTSKGRLLADKIASDLFCIVF